MSPELLIAILSGLGGMFGWGIADFLAKKTITTLGDVTTLFWCQFLGIFPLLALFLSAPSIPHIGYLELIWLAVLGIWSGLSYIPTYVAFGKGKVSLLSPLFACYAVVVTILSAILLHEAIPLGRQIAFGVVFFGVLLISGDSKSILMLVGIARVKSEKVKGFKEILLAICLYSTWLIALDQLVNGKDWAPLLLIIRVFSAISLFGYAKATKRRLRVVDSALWKYLIFIGCFDVAAFACVSFGFSRTPFVSIVAMLSGAFSLPTIVLARIFLKERTTTVQTVGSLIVVVGVMLLAVL